MDMKAIFWSSLVLSFASVSFANTTLNVVGNYNLASSPAIWANTRSDDISKSLLKEFSVDSPARAYSELFPNAFYQNDNYVVCYRNCSKPDASSGKNVLEQQNVYFWLDQLFKMTKDKFNLIPGNRLRVMTSREFATSSAKELRNNAFFNSADNTLTFLQASANPLAGFYGERVNRSGFDPSVIIHEAGHALFYTLFPTALNKEMDGFSEGFADYLANILLGNSKLGLIMLRGIPVRDSESFVDSSKTPKTYQPGLPVHDLGERFSTALWLGRKKVKNVDEYDSLVINTVRDISKNPFSTAHGFKKAFLNRVSYTYDPLTSKSIASLWEILMEGDDRVILDKSFLNTELPREKTFGYKMTTVYSESFANDFGISTENKRFVYMKSAVTKDGFRAYLLAGRNDSAANPYWILFDHKRKNALAAWSIDGSPISKTEQIKEVSALVPLVRINRETMVDFHEQSQAISSLIKGEGSLAAIYKVSQKKVENKTIELNGVSFESSVYTLVLNRKILAPSSDAPAFKAVTLTTVKNANILDWPNHDGDSIIGISTQAIDGTKSELIFETLE